MNAAKEEWKTATIKDDCMPNWNETRDFTDIDPARSHIYVDVYDKNHRGKDDHMGSAKFAVENLLRKRLMEVELRSGTAPTKSYVTLTCVQLTANKELTHGVGDVLIHCQPELGDEGVESTILNGDVTTPLVSPSRIPSHVGGLPANNIDDGSVVSTCSDRRKPRRLRGLPERLRKKLNLPRKDSLPIDEERSI